MQVHPDSVMENTEAKFLVWPHDQCYATEIEAHNWQDYELTSNMFTFVNQTFKNYFEL